MEWLQEPLKVWHLAVVAIAFGITLGNMQKQMNAIGKCVFDVWEKFRPRSNDDY
jgi:hypothetical protein